MNRQLAVFLDRAVRAFVFPFGVRRRQMVLAQLAPRLVPEVSVATAQGEIRLACEGRQALYWARFFHTHEPETLEWIRSFGPKEVFWDVGANVGVYSFYAALAAGARVLAFEPGAANYHALNRNIRLNRMQDRVIAYCLAFSDRTEISTLNLRAAEAGGDTNVYGEGPDSWGNTIEGVMRQGAMGFALDDFIARFDPPFPTHMKINVDGAEDMILAGAAKTLADPRLKSLLVEFPDQTSARSRTMRQAIEGAGLTLGAASTGAHATWQNLIFRRA